MYFLLDKGNLDCCLKLAERNMLSLLVQVLQHDFRMSTQKTSCPKTIRSPNSLETKKLKSESPHKIKGF